MVLCVTDVARSRSFFLPRYRALWRPCKGTPTSTYYKRARKHTHNELPITVQWQSRNHCLPWLVHFYVVAALFCIAFVLVCFIMEPSRLNLLITLCLRDVARSHRFPAEVQSSLEAMQRHTDQHVLQACIQTDAQWADCYSLATEPWPLSPLTGLLWCRGSSLLHFFCFRMLHNGAFEFEFANHFVCQRWNKMHNKSCQQSVAGFCWPRNLATSRIQQPLRWYLMHFQAHLAHGVTWSSPRGQECNDFCGDLFLLLAWHSFPYPLCKTLIWFSVVVFLFFVFLLI